MSKITFTIGEMATLLGITSKTLRHYHKIGLLDDPQRDSNNYRLYTIDQLEAIQRILRLKSFGLSLKQIKIIFEAANPDVVIRTVLKQHEQKIREEIRQLQHYLDDTQGYLKSNTGLLEPVPRSSQYSAMIVVSDTVKRQSNGLSDILVKIEGVALGKIDCYEWASGYEQFWHQIGKDFINNLEDKEGLFIFWMERYLALEKMNDDDLQAKAWLQELRYSPARKMLAGAFQPPISPFLPEKDQQQIQKLLPSLLYEQGSILQKKFLSILINP